MSDLPYRPCVGVMLINNQSDVFTGQRIDQSVEAWQMPQGGVDEGEEPLDAAFREMEEEIGTADAEVLAESSRWLTYDLPPHLVGKVWKGRYRGQRMKWYALRFRGQDQDINLNTRHPEFMAWRWQRFEQLPDLIVPFKRALYAQLVQEFAPLIARLRADGV